MSKHRKKQGLFVAEGTTNVLDFAKNKIDISELFATKDWISKYVDHLNSIIPIEVNEKEMGQVSFLKNPSEVLAICQLPEQSPLDLTDYSELTIMLDDIRDPGNLGTIIRTADWFGINDIICSENTADAFNPKVVQASMGSLSRVNVHYQNLENLLGNKPDFLKVFGAVLDGSPIDDVAKPHKGIILIGNEAHGISDELIPLIDLKITIPSIKHTSETVAESLNASIATAIICYTFSR